MLKGKVPIAISVDSITNTVNTVLGSSVVLAIMLAMIRTVINYIKIKERKVPFFPNAFWLMIRHGFFSFGVVTALSIMWQRYLGTIEVGLIPAVLPHTCCTINSGDSWNSFRHNKLFNYKKMYST